MSEIMSNPATPGKDKKKKNKDKKSLGEIQAEVSFKLEPSDIDPKSLNTSDWPLLLKNFDRLNVRSNHYTPLPFGSSPLQVILFFKHLVVSLKKENNF
jgi:H/ACA ribonucleoprotein complex subunit 4